jgi:hypothetical protein
MTTADENLALKERLRTLEARINRPLSSEERDEMAAAHARCDAVARYYNDTASQPVPGETPLQYRQRLARHFQGKSTTFRDTDLSRLDSASLMPIETAIYDEARRAATDPANQQPGRMFAVQERDPAGRLITKFFGDSLAWRTTFMTGAQVGRIKSPGEIAADQRA